MLLFLMAEKVTKKERYFVSFFIYFLFNLFVPAKRLQKPRCPHLQKAVLSGKFYKLALLKHIKFLNRLKRLLTAREGNL